MAKSRRAKAVEASKKPTKKGDFKVASTKKKVENVTKAKSANMTMKKYLQKEPLKKAADKKESSKEIEATNKQSIKGENTPNGKEQPSNVRSFVIYKF